MCCVNPLQSITFTNLKSTFLKKFIEKRHQRQIVQKLLNQDLLPLNAVKPNTFTLNFDVLTEQLINILTDAIEGHLYKDNGSEKSLQLQSIQSIPTISIIPVEFMQLLDSEIFNYAEIINSSEQKQL